ncbi:AAA domain-containing protein [Panaeolus papilionaceus]|nr:AAA domain-containing protein [Panaeolus papilionaceus]
MAYSQEAEILPLLGDSQGRYRVYILGNSGSGKSTTAKELAAILKVPVISMDQIMWGPGWTPSSNEEFQEKLRRKMAESPNGWIADGDYLRKGSQIAFDDATDVIWLDPPLLLYFPRIIIRTLRRLLHLDPPCCEGCPETVSEAFFSRKSILLWSLSGHWSNRRINAEKMQEYDVSNGSRIESRKMRRIGGWGGDLRTWMASVKRLLSK